MANQKCVVSTTPLLNEQAPLFFSPLVARVIWPAGWKGGLLTLLANGRRFVNTIGAIIEDAAGWQRSQAVHEIFAFRLSALVLSSLVPGITLFLFLD